MTGQYNFVFPVTTLIGSDFRLEPFDTAKHATAYWEATGPDPDLYAYMSIGPYSTESAMIQEFIDARDAIPSNQLYAIMTTRQPKNQTQPSTQTMVLAGVVGWCAANAVHSKAEIGPIILTSRYQGIGLAISVAELMMSHALKAETEGGWGLRRVQWLANTANEASIRLAERLGFRREGLIKADMVMRDGIGRGKIGNGRALPPGSEAGDLGRDSLIFGKCWDD